MHIYITRGDNHDKSILHQNILDHFHNQLFDSSVSDIPAYEVIMRLDDHQARIGRWILIVGLSALVIEKGFFYQLMMPMILIIKKEELT